MTEKFRGDIKMQATQRAAVLAALKAGMCIDRDMNIPGCGRVIELPSRISELRKKGWPILTLRKKELRYCRYLMIGAGAIQEEHNTND